MANPPTSPARRKPAPLLVFLWAVFVLFCGILVFVWISTRRAHPVMLDSQGHPVEQSQPQGGAR